MKKRTAALLLFVLVVLVIAGTIGVLRTRWAADRICAAAAERIERATGLPLAVEACRIRPLALEVEAEGIRLGPLDAPLFTADALSAKLAPVQTLGRQLHLQHLRLVRPRVVAKLPASSPGEPGPCPPEILSRFEIRDVEVESGAVDLTFAGGGRAVVHRFDVRSVPPRGLRAFAVPARRARLALTAGPARLEDAGRVFVVASASAELEAALDLSGVEIASAEAEVAGVRFGLRGTVHDLCAPRLELAASVEGRIADALALAGVTPDGDGTFTALAKVSGTARAPDVAATVAWKDARMGAQRPGTGRAELRIAAGLLTVDRLELPLADGTIVARGTVGLERGLPVKAEIDAGGADLAEILDRIGVRGPWITLKLQGKAIVDGTLSPPALTGSLALDLADFKALTRSWLAGPDDPGVVAFARGRLEAPVRVDREGLYFDGGRVTVGRGTVTADATIRFSTAGGFSVRCSGEADLDALGRIGEVPWAGLATVEATTAAAPYGNPHIEGRARIDGFRFLDIDLGTAAAGFVYDDFLLRFRGGEGVRNVTRYRGEGIVDLRPYPPHIVSSRFEAKGKLRDVFDAVRDWLPRTKPLRDAMDGEVEASGTATGPADALDTEFQVRLGSGSVYGQRYESGRAEGRIHRALEVRLDRAELRRGAGVARTSGTWGVLPPFPWDLEGSFAGVALGDLDLPGAGWSGSVAGTATLHGSFEHPRVKFAMNGDAVHAQGLALGTVQLGGGVTGQRVVVTMGADGMWLEGEASLAGRMPFRARAGLALQDVTRLLPGAVPAGFRARVAGEGAVEGELADAALAQGSFRIDQVQAGYADFRVEAAKPAVVEVNRGRVEVHGLVLRGANTELALSGARAANGELDLSAAGGVDLRLLSGLAPMLKRPSGRLALEAHVGGSAEAPVLVGSGRVEDAAFELRATSLAFSGIRGDLAFSQNRVLFDGLEASVNGGRVRLEGEAELSSFSPVRHRVEAELDHVALAVPADLPATLSGRIEAAGTPDDTVVTGRLHVVRARYTANVDLERNMLELKRRTPPPPRPYDRAGEWLRFDVQVAADGDVRVENDLVRGAVSGELTLTGTLAAPGLLGTLSMAEGSRVTFRGNEFLLTHAVLDFVDRNRIGIALDVHGESQVRDYQIFMHVFGSLAEPQVTLTSAPALTQPDIITLLSLGFTRRDTAAGTGVGSFATAAAAQALFSASGLDEQVKRFLPRGGLMRDFSVRITSAYSEGTGQVEPRAEFESWMLRDRLRLRYQAPLAGARGQKAEAELRLGNHTAVQYQWDNDDPDVGTGDHGVDLKLRWEWTDR